MPYGKAYLIHITCPQCISKIKEVQKYVESWINKNIQFTQQWIKTEACTK